MMRSIVHFIVTLVMGAGLAGCFGIAHTKVDVDPLKVQLSLSDDWNPDSPPIYIFNAPFYGNSSAFVSLIKDSIAADLPASEWRAASTTTGRSIYVEFPLEQRYIGFPVFVLSFSPSSETTHSRTIFLRLEEDGNVYRIRLVGDRTSVEKASISEARAGLTPILYGAAPKGGSQAWSERLKAESDYYRDIRWTTSDRLSISDVRKRDGHDLLSIRVGSRHDG